MIYWIALKSIWRKEVNRFIRIWVQTLIPSVITITLYFIIFGNLIGPKIGAINGFSYIQFIVPGLIMMAIITNSYNNVASSFFSAKFQRNIEELLVAPIPNHIIIVGYIGGGVLRSFCIGVLVTTISLIFTPLKIYNWNIVLIVLILTSILFSLAGLLNAIFAKNFDDISIVPNFILIPLTYLGGVFYSVNFLLPSLQIVSKFNPIIYMISGFRYGFLGICDVPLKLTFEVLIILTVLSYLFCLYLLNHGYGLKP